MNKEIRIENWSVVTLDPYKPPELGIYLAGEVYGHPRFQDGFNATTSRIVEVDGTLIATQSGSSYRLGKVNPDYRKYVEEILKEDWDEECPLRVRFVGFDHQDYGMSNV